MLPCTSQLQNITATKEAPLALKVYILTSFIFNVITTQLKYVQKNKYYVSLNKKGMTENTLLIKFAKEDK